MSDKQIQALEAMGKVATSNAKNINALSQSHDALESRIKQVRSLMNHMAQTDPDTKHTLEGLGDFLLDIRNHKTQQPMSGMHSDYDFQSRGLNSTTKANATTQSDVNAGFLVPDILEGGINLIRNAIVGLLPLVPKIQLAPGSTLKINKEATRVSASWRMAECTAIPETDLLLDQMEVSPALIGGIVPVSQELFNYPGAGFGELVAITALSAVIAKQEASLIAGDSSIGGAAAPPADGVLVDAAVIDYATGITLPGGYSELLDFIQFAVDTVPSLYGTGVLIMHPSKAVNLLKQAAAATTLDGGLNQSLPTQIAGLTLVFSEFMLDGGTQKALIMDPSDVLVGETPFRVDVNPYASPGWASNCLSLKTYAYMDWVLMRPERMFKTDFLTV